MKSEIINRLKEWRTTIIDDLKKTKIKDQSQILKLKIELDNALACLELCYKFDIQPQNIQAVIELPLPSSGDFSEYRIMDDAESENQEFWKELIINNKKIFLYKGDFILKRK